MAFEEHINETSFGWDIIQNELHSYLKTSSLCLELSSCLLIHSTSSTCLSDLSLLHIPQSKKHILFYSPQGIYLARSGIGGHLHLKGGVGLLDKHGLCAGPKGQWELDLGLGKLLDYRSVPLCWLWALPPSWSESTGPCQVPIMVALGDGTCRGQIWILTVYLQTILPNPGEYVWLTNSGMQDTSIAFHKWTWFLL